MNGAAMQPRFHLGTTATLVAALDRARTIRLDSYVLRNPRLLRGLERAAGRGADVCVHLCADPVSGEHVRAANRKTVRTLRAHGVRVVAEPRFGRRAGHDKIAVVDGRVFLDDRNWRTSRDETVIIDGSARDAEALRSGRPAAGIAQTKAEALAAEVCLIANTGGHDVLVATESFGAGPVADALIARSRHGDRVRLLYNDRALTPSAAPALRRLRAAGVEVRVSRANHKAACGGGQAWIGSANATEPGSGRDWGIVAGGALARGLRARLDAAWSAAG